MFIKHLFLLGCYIGVTYGAFSPQTTIWLNVCENENINASLCSVFSSEDCNNLILLDMVVTRNHIVFATTFGLVKSASFSLLITEHSILEKVTGDNFRKKSLSPFFLTNSF